MLAEGVRLMVVGMTTVFAFLGLLVVAMHANRAFAALFPEPAAPPPALPEEAEADEQIAVVLAAVAAARGR